VDAAFDIFLRLPVMKEIPRDLQRTPSLRPALHALMSCWIPTRSIWAASQTTVPQIAIVDLKGMPTQKRV